MKGIQLVRKYYLTCAFLLLLILPIVFGTFGIVEFERASENRVFTDSLNIDVNHLDEFPEEANAYINDNFPFRTPLLETYHRLKFYVFGTSPHPDKTILGRDGWYFMAGREQGIVEGKYAISSDTLQLIVDEWKDRKAYFEEKGIEVYWMIPPIKHNVYSEYLPFHVVPGKARRIEPLIDRIHREIPGLVIDPVEAFGQRKQERLYYKQDNHWTYHAGKIMTEEFIKKVSQKFDELSYSELSVTWVDSMVYDGIHHKVIGIGSNGEMRSVPRIHKRGAMESAKYGFPPVEGFPYPWEHERRFLNESAKNKLKILIIRDSFGEQLMPFMAEYFRESVFIWDSWQYKRNDAIVEEVKPDIVLYISLESNIESFVK